MAQKTVTTDQERPSFPKPPQHAAAWIAATALTGLCTVAFPQMSLAQAVSWEGSVSDDWFDAANWDGGLPAAGTDAFLDTVTPNPTLIDGGNAATHVLGIGEDDVGALTIQAGGELDSNRGLLGMGGSASGTLTVTGAESAWTTAYSSAGLGNAAIHVGDMGEGLLEIGDGARVTAGSTFGAFNGMIIGRHGDASGQVVVTGDDSLLQVHPRMFVGYAGQGSLIIEDGGRVEHILGGGNNQQGQIGFAGGHGEVEIRGAGSEWTIGNNLHVGDGREGAGSTGTLLIEDDGRVVNSFSFVGFADDSEGTAIVRTGGRWENGGLEVGTQDTSRGTLLIEDGGLITSSYGGLGREAGTFGSATISGPDARWNIVGTPGAAPQTAAMTVGHEGSGSLVLQDGGTLSASSVEIAGQETAFGELTIGSLVNGLADGPAAPGVLSSNSLSFGVGEGQLVFNHSDTSGDYEFGAGISGASGFISHLAGTTSFSGVSAEFAGSTTVVGGTLVVDGSLGGDLTVDGGVLGGEGSLGSVTIGSGGTIAPGNSIGTLSIESIVFDAESIYRIELSDGDFVAGFNNDLIEVSETAVINGGSVHVTPVNGSDDGSTFTPGTYTILTAAGGVTGTFDSITDDFAFLDLALDYDSDNVFLISSAIETPTGGFCLPGYSANQCATGDGVASLGAGDPIHDAVLVLSEGEARNALDLLSGEVHASIRTALIDDSRFVREASFDRSRRAPGKSVGNPAGSADGQDDAQTAMGIRGFAAWGRWSGDANVAQQKRSIRGFFFGPDGELTEHVNVGLIAGYSRSKMDVDERLSSVTADSYHLGAYLGGEWQQLSLRGGAAHTWHRMDVDRSVEFTGVTEALAASSKAYSLQAFGEAAFGIELEQARLEPFFSVAHVRHKASSSNEQGGQAALSVAGDTSNVTSTSLGVRAETQFDLGEADVSLRGTVGWRRAFGDTRPDARQDFRSGGDTFAITGSALAKNTLILDAGLATAIGSRTTLAIAYDGQFGSDYRDHGGRVDLTVRF